MNRPLNFVLVSGQVDPLLPQAAGRRFWPVPVTRPMRFRISATRADGHTSEWAAIGGNSCDHAMTAMDVAGLGGVIRVLPITETEAA